MAENIKVLYVEDNEDVAQSTTELLVEFFDEIDHASNGQEGYEKFREKSYDLIITDMKMPVLNGLEMIKMIREKDNDISIVVISAYDEPEYFSKCIEENVDGYILKPINLEQLTKVLNKRIKRINQTKQIRKSAKLIQEYQNALDSSAIVSKTDINGIITYANSKFAKLSGYTVEELVGQNHNIIRHPDTPSGIFEDMWTTLLNKHVWRGRVKNRKKNGEHYWVNVVINPIVDEKGEIIEFIAVRTDITLEVEYQKTLESRVQKQIKLIREKDKILHYQSQHAAMGEMIDSIAHQWKQPISVIKMNVDMLGYDFADHLLDSKKIEEFQEKVFSQIEHMNNTLEEFRGFLRHDKKVTKFDIEKTVRSALILVQDEFIKYNINTQIIVEEPMIINGIENEFKHVILNLLNNAKDAFIEKNIKDKQIIITINKDTFRVRDNAGGIPEDVLENIFEPNITTKEHGTGIGLYMTKQIIEKLNGTIEAKNKENGACFTIKI